MLDATAASAPATFAAGQTLTAGRTNSPANDILGSVTLAGGVLNFGTPGTIATLTEANGAFGLSGGTVNFDLLKTLGVNDVVNVDNLSLSNLTTLVLTADNYALATGSYHLFNFSGTVTGGTTNLAADLVNINTGTTRQQFNLGVHDRRPTAMSRWTSPAARRT